MLTHIQTYLKRFMLPSFSLPVAVHLSVFLQSNYPWYFRAAVSDGLAADAVAHMIAALGWSNAASISDLTWFGVTTQFVATCQTLNIQVKTQVTSAQSESKLMTFLWAADCNHDFCINHFIHDSPEGIWSDGNCITSNVFHSD